MAAYKKKIITTPRYEPKTPYITNVENPDSLIRLEPRDSPAALNFSRIYTAE